MSAATKYELTVSEWRAMAMAMAGKCWKHMSGWVCPHAAQLSAKYRLRCMHCTMQINANVYVRTCVNTCMVYCTDTQGKLCWKHVSYVIWCFKICTKTAVPHIVLFHNMQYLLSHTAHWTIALKSKHLLRCSPPLLRLARHGALNLENEIWLLQLGRHFYLFRQSL